LRQEGCASDQESLLSPNLLPRFFGPGSQEVSPLAINTTFPRGHLGMNEGVGFEVMPPTPPPESEPCERAFLTRCAVAEQSDNLDVEADPATLLDLTGQIRREGRCALIPVRALQVLIPCFSYPQAHGGFADVWKGVWDRQPDRWVCRVPTLVNPN
jgi:hypothetical protein